MAKRKAEFDIQANDKSSATLKRVGGSVATLDSKLRKLKGVAAGALGAFATGAVVGKLAAFTKAGLDNIDMLAKLSDRMGVSIESARAYKNAADLAGVSIGTLEKGLGRLNKNIGDIKNGLIEESSPVFKAFEKLGVSLDDLNSKSPEQIFEDLVEKLGKIPDTATQGALAMAIFGRSGQQLITVFKGGLAGIDESRKLIKDLGLEMDRVDAAQIEAANDSMTRLQQVSQAAKDKLALELAPVIDAVFTRLVESGREGSNMGDMIASGVETALSAGIRFYGFLGMAGGGIKMIGDLSGIVFGKLVQGMSVASEWVSRLFGETIPEKLNSLLIASEDGITKMKQGFADFATSSANVVVAGMNKATQAVDSLVNGAAAGISKFIDLANKVPGVGLPAFSYSQKSELQPSFSRFPVTRADLGRVPTFGEDFRKSRELEAKAGADLASRSLENLYANSEKVAAATKNLLNPGENKLMIAFQEAREEAKALAGTLTGENPSSEDGGGNGVDGALKKIKKAAEEAGAGISDALTQARQSADSVLGNISSAIDEFTRTGKLNFADFARSVIADLAAVQLKAALIGTDGQSGIVGSILGAFTGTGTGGGGYSFDGGGYTGRGSRSGGVDGKGGFPAILHPNETVVDHTKGGGGSQVIVQQTVQVRETLPSGQARQIAAEAQKAAVAAMQQINRRGGGRRTAFGLGMA